MLIDKLFSGYHLGLVDKDGVHSHAPFILVRTERMFLMDFAVYRSMTSQEMFWKRWPFAPRRAWRHNKISE